MSKQQQSSSSLKQRFMQEELDDDDLNMILAVFGEEERQGKWRSRRLDWNEHVRREIHTNTFEMKYHMRLDSFEKLVDFLRPLISVDKLQSIRSTSGNDPVKPEHIVGMGLRFLGGELIKSLEDIFGIDDSYVRVCITNFLDAVDVTFNFSLPKTDAEKKALAAGFKERSTSEGTFDGVIGAIDGWLCSTIQPRDSYILNKRDYYSGHYQCFGMNVQAICDAKLRFIYFAVAAPGRTNDARAILKCEQLQILLDSLKEGNFFLVGDNAYVLCDEMLIPFSGNSMSEINRTYNFFLSQLRIRIEMAFGRLTTKWRIFRRDLENKMDTVSKICRVAAKLHNYVIDEALVVGDDDIDVYDGAPRNLGYLPHHPEDIGESVVPEDGYVIPVGFSARRTAIVEEIARMCLSRPARNVQRNG